MVNEEQFSLFDLAPSAESATQKEFNPDLIPTSAKIPIPIAPIPPWSK